MLQYLHVKRYVCPSYFYGGLGLRLVVTDLRPFFLIFAVSFFILLSVNWNGRHDVGRFYLQTISVTLRRRKKSTQKQKKYFADIKNNHIFAVLKTIRRIP